ncbi:hypothetical protein [Pseudomonas aeruginosa]|uniref:hypothetical protein n=1 Tax=Pseudomonas aeruginosa TaxID=287 RepID=UPI000FD5FA9E|nr:hypothetical protein [Pseudomonas aeruginosa]MCW4647287.1 hypothetical protein [Pseudomonas aeruginosa]RUG15327.1 hypothetical protein IPC762_26150 [Pseudomonas aeruginosa]
MAKLKVYCCPIAGREEHMVAAPSRKAAAELLGLSVYELTTYGTDASDTEQVIALAEPGAVFRKGDGFSGSNAWAMVRPAPVQP